MRRAQYPEECPVFEYAGRHVEVRPFFASWLGLQCVLGLCSSVYPDGLFADRVDFLDELKPLTPCRPPALGLESAMSAGLFWCLIGVDIFGLAIGVPLLAYAIACLTEDWRHQRRCAAIDAFQEAQREADSRRYGVDGALR